MVERVTYQPNEPILRQGQHVDYFFMVTRGMVEVVLCNRRKEVTVARLGPGQFFGEVELIRGGQSIACVRAAPEGSVELAALPRAGFRQLVSDSALTEEALGKIVQLRLEENRIADRRQSKRGQK